MSHAPDGPPIESSALIFVPSQPTENQSNASTENFYAAGAIERAAGGDPDRNGNGSRGNGVAVMGTGAGNGPNSSGYGAILTQPGYRETPKPKYPESARRRGREGTVLLRVLVNAEGRTKTIEINQSSGDDSLDRAASEAIQQWRFIPARYGQKAVESWIRIPVDFRLADSNAR